jgi:PKD repeat protein
VAGLTVYFANNSYSDITSTLWDFGDGNTSTTDYPMHTYAVAGCYSVTLRIENPYGMDVTTMVVDLSLPATGPTANFNDPRDMYMVIFSDTSTAGTAPISSWYWDFGDGNTSNAQSPIHTYPQGVAGTYTVTLTVTDADGLSDTESRTFTLGACEYSTSNSATLVVEQNLYDPTEYEVYLKNADCSYGGFSGIVNGLNSYFTVTVPVGKGYYIRQILPCTTDITNGIVPAGGSTINLVTACP